jgi:UMP-CMP kinase|mmetsp:Transcript_11282/g.10912  ORF Transcript_11282/g.10912 Transcript_11282/m.10912 type:complete len:338 (-) Transcript_11282:238-1251(-)
MYINHLSQLLFASVFLLRSDIFIISLRLQPFRVSFILGGPAAGKSTQCKKLVDDYGCKHLSAGDLLREERASGSTTANLIESYINEGAIVPVGITLELLRIAMEKSKASRFLVDGFPRNEDNLQGWNNMMTEESCIVDSIIFIECPEDECKKRIIERSKTSGRSDDNLATLAKRFVTFNDITLPVIKNFEHVISLDNENNKRSKKVSRIAGDRDIEKVYKDMKIAYESMVVSELLQLSEKLLKAEDDNDTDILDSLVHESRTVISSDIIGDKNSVSLMKRSSMVRPHVRMMGKSAIISYIRLLQEDLKTTSCEDTRIWQLNDDGLWKNVHFHRVNLE